MSSNFVKRYNAIGWDWYLVTNEDSSWVSHMVKEHIEQVEAENAKLREYVAKLEMANIDVTARLTDYIGQYDPTDAFVAEVKADNAKLQDENARLRSCLSDDAENARQIMAENAKLRELVRDMWFWGYEGHMGSESQDWQMKHIDGVLDRMRELGVEVD